MFKLVVLTALVACAVAAPGVLHGGHLAYGAAPLAYSAHVAAPVVSHSVLSSVPTGVSHQRSSVVHHSAVHAPVVHTAVHAAPVVSTYAAHGLVGTHGLIGAHGYAAHGYAAHGYAAPLAVAHAHHGVHGVHGVHVY